MALNKVLNEVKKSIGFSNIDDIYSIKEYIHTGNYLLNAIISADIDKGLPRGKILQLAGEESTGKTYITLEIARNAQEQGYNIILFDSEFAISKEDLIKRKINLDKFDIIPVTSVENFREVITKIIDSYDPKEDGKLMFILDSLGNLYTSKEYVDAISGSDKTDMTRTRILKSIFRIVTINCGIKGIPFIVTNHVYANINSFIKSNVISGGSGSKYASSITLELTKAQDKESNGQVVGAIITVKSIKNRLAKEKTKIKININYNKGLDPYSGLLDYAIQFGIVKDLGRKKIEYNGKKYSIKDLDKEFWDKVFSETDFKDKIHQYFSYGEELSLENENTSDSGEIKQEQNELEG